MSEKLSSQFGEIEDGLNVLLDTESREWTHSVATQVYASIDRVKIYILVDGEFFWVVALSDGDPMILGSSHFEDAMPQDVMPYINSLCCLFGTGDPKIFRLDVSHIMRQYFKENYKKFDVAEGEEIEWVGETTVLDVMLRDRPDFLLAAKEADDLGFIA